MGKIYWGRMKSCLVFLFLIGLGVLSSGWGYLGHEKIAKESELSFSPLLISFKEWVPYIIDHSADPDARKSLDNSEAPKHYIDVDGYPDFIKNGQIPQQIDTLILKYGRSFVTDQGTLPWATITTYDSIVCCFKRSDFEKAKFFSADLSHYVADGFMPLHITSNYNGQFTGNTGIHSRYESNMIAQFINRIDYKGGELQKIDNIENYIFKYIYNSYRFKDSILEADNYSKIINSNTSTSAYSEAMWSKTSQFTIQLFHDASHAFSELLYNAWAEAGMPNIEPNSVVSIEAHKNLQIRSVNRSHGDSTFIVNYYLPTDEPLSIEIVDINGKMVHQSKYNKQIRGENELRFSIGNFAVGTYFFILKSDKEVAIKKLTLS